MQILAFMFAHDYLLAPLLLTLHPEPVCLSRPYLEQITLLEAAQVSRKDAL